jgi:hypothetical protein
MQRLFQRGHYEEDIVVGYLRGIGADVEQVSENGEQIRIFDVSNHFGGSSDGSAMLPERYALPDKFLLEIKTVKDGNYDKMKDVRTDNVQHWKQMNVYGYKRDIKYAVYFLSNKDDDRLFIQVVQLDPEVGRQCIAEATWLVSLTTPPMRISNKPDWWECKKCDHYDICQLRNDTPDRNCRTCKNSRPIEQGYWACDLWQQVLPDKAAQLQGCDRWEGLEY